MRSLARQVFAAKRRHTNRVPAGELNLTWGKAAGFGDILTERFMDHDLAAVFGLGVARRETRGKTLGFARRARQVVGVAHHDSPATWYQKSRGAASLIERMSLSSAVLPTNTIIPSGEVKRRAIERPCQIPRSGSVGPGGPFGSARSLRLLVIAARTYQARFDSAPLGIAIS